jgi:hypothetical protein
MPDILDRLVSQLIKKGHSEKSAYAIATSQLQKSGKLKKKSTKAVAKNKKSKTPTYKYNKKTNRATLKKGKK